MFVQKFISLTQKENQLLNIFRGNTLPILIKVEKLIPVSE